MTKDNKELEGQKKGFLEQGKKVVTPTKTANSPKRLDPRNPVFHDGQVKAWEYWVAGKRVILVCSGSQGGKSSYGAIWTNAVLSPHRFEKVNFIVATPTYKIMQQATLFALMDVFGPLGWRLHKVDGFLDHPKWKPKILLRTAENPNSCEGVQRVVGAWLDEGGQCSRLFWENIQSRTSFEQAPLLITTTPYAMNWVHNELIQPFEKKIRDDIGYVVFPSIANPSFPKEEYERQKGLLDPQSFARRYEGVHAKMQGLVYPDYTSSRHVCEDFKLPHGTKYFAGVDWGYSPDPFAIVVRAITPDGRHFDVKAFKGTHKTPSEKVMVAKGFQSLYPIRFWICGHDEPGSIQEFNNNGLKAITCVVGKNSVEERIEKHNELIRTDRYQIFESAKDALDDEYNTYFRHPQTGIPEGEDHLMDATGMVSHYLSTYPTTVRTPSLPGESRPARNPDGRRLRPGGSEKKVNDVWEI